VTRATGHLCSACMRARAFIPVWYYQSFTDARAWQGSSVRNTRQGQYQQGTAQAQAVGTSPPAQRTCAVAPQQQQLHATHFQVPHGSRAAQPTGGRCDGGGAGSQRAQRVPVQASTEQQLGRVESEFNAQNSAEFLAYVSDGWACPMGCQAGGVNRLAQRLLRLQNLSLCNRCSRASISCTRRGGEY